MKLDKDWRQGVELLGKRNFENLEMLRLGFITENDMAAVGLHAERLNHYETALQQLLEARQQLQETDKNLAELQDIAGLLAEIRKQRIERVKKERALRKAEKEQARIARRAAHAERRRTSPSYLGRRVSRHLTFEGGDPEKLARASLPEMSAFVDLAAALRLSPERLQWLTFERLADPTDHYTRFEIPKRSGGKRLISSPKPSMRQAQAWVREQILAKRPVSEAATAFRPGMSITYNAARHLGAAVVVRMDLADFFPNIVFRRVFRYFESLGYNPGIATVLGLICTDAPRVRLTMDDTSSWVVVGERGLPQGACTSPDLANLIAYRLDQRLLGLSRSKGWNYTRYADDMVFSSPDPEVNVGQLLGAITRISNEEGFKVNEAKTRVMRAPNRQMVTGLMVGDSVRVTRQMKRRIRAFLHQCERDGLEETSNRIDKDAKSVALGLVAFLNMVEPVAATAFKDKYEWL